MAIKARVLSDYTLDEQNQLALRDFPALLALRRAAYRAHLARMTVAPEVVAWAARMAARFGGKVKAHANAVSWPLALLIARYGEAIDVADPETGELRQFWPDAFSADDVKRAVEWEQGLTPMTKYIMPLHGKTTALDGSVPFGLDEED